MMRSLFANIERWVWYAFLATVGWQTRTVLWQADLRFSEWRSIALWGTDVFMLALLVCALVRGWRFRRPKRTEWLLIALCAVVVLSAFGAPLPVVAWYQVARLVQYAVFFLWLRSWVFVHQDARASVLAFVAGTLGEAGLAVAQSLAQHDIGVRWAGETLLNTGMQGVAVFFVGAQKFLRAYGTLPHPNVLAVQLLAGLWGLLWLYLGTGVGRTRWHRAQMALFAFSGALMLWALYATYSRTMIVAGGGATALVAVAAFWPRISGAWRNIGAVRVRLYRALVLVAVVSGIFVAVNLPQVRARASLHSSDEAVQFRLDYARDSLDSGGRQFLHINWFGVGIGNFTTWLATEQPRVPNYYLQPAHNVFLLMYTESGVFALLLFIAFLVSVARRAWTAHADQPLVRLGMLAMLGAFVFIALFDHFFWTLQQGRILFWLILAISAGVSRSGKS